MVDVDVWWTLLKLKCLYSIRYVVNNNTIPVFPHMMWGFFLSPVCHSVISLLF
ncbi:hypothetical protein AA481_003658 [Salmonella enterica subsp. enterica]|nr:hypothetical protein [Salmonella enterica subsp. enterica serovar Abaetetuba]